METKDLLLVGGVGLAVYLLTKPAAAATPPGYPPPGYPPPGYGYPPPGGGGYGNNGYPPGYGQQQANGYDLGREIVKQVGTIADSIINMFG